MNKGGLWKVPKWYFRLFHQFLTPITIITFLIFFTLDYAKAGNFNLVPSYVANMPSLVIWVNLGRIAVIGVLIVGYIQSYKAIKNKYKYEIDGIVEFHKRGADVMTSAAWMFLGCIWTTIFVTIVFL